MAILPKSHYKIIVLSQFNDKVTYEKLSSNPEDPIMKTNQSFKTKYTPSFTDPEQKYLNRKYFDASNFHEHSKSQIRNLKKPTIKQNKELI